MVPWHITCPVPQGIEKKANDPDSRNDQGHLSKDFIEMIYLFAIFMCNPRHVENIEIKHRHFFNVGTFVAFASLDLSAFYWSLAITYGQAQK